MMNLDTTATVLMIIGMVLMMSAPAGIGRLWNRRHRRVQR
jgi:hypothetical protein